MGDIVKGSDGQPRCGWCNAAPEFPHYHDTEWGFPIDDDRRLFEKLCLESFQSGLSWRTILTKRENFRKAFHQFDYKKVACFTEEDIEELLTNKGIVRHRGKIEAVINNAKRVNELIEKEGSLAAFVWRYEPTNNKARVPQSASTSPESISLAKELKKRGWKFVGPTTVYAFMQAMGLFNDHVEGCITKDKVQSARKEFKKPS
jgi:DNA-3-methyladenine glycosylase I